VHIVIYATELLVRKDLDGHEEVARLAAPRARVPGAGHAQLHEVPHTGGNIHTNFPWL